MPTPMTLAITKHPATNGPSVRASEAGAGELYRILYRRKTIPIISKRAEAQLQKADKWAFDSCTLGVNLDWAFHPDRAG